MYYTPSIEEFHVGFEYEYFNKLSNQWGKASVTEIAFLEHREYYSKRDEYMKLHFRIKYLDKEDIESLGFTRLPDIENLFKYKTHYTTHGLKDPKEWFYWHISLLERSNKRPNLIISNNEDYDALDVVFEGWIKNKSELKILLKQLQIT